MEIVVGYKRDRPRKTWDEVVYEANLLKSFGSRQSKVEVCYQANQCNP